jgi:flagellar hook-associated protein 2
MSTIPSSANSAANSVAAATAAANAAQAAAAQSIISGSTGNSSLDVSSLVSAFVNAKVAGPAGTITAQAASDNAKLSAIGVLTAALSAFEAGITSLTDGTGLGSFMATASGTGLTASGDSTASAGSYSIGVTQIASAQTLSSSPFNPKAQLGTGTMNLSINGKSMDIAITPDNDTVAGIAATINAASNNPGVTATVVTGTDGAHLVLRATNSGQANTINVAVSGVANDNGLSSLGVTSAPGATPTATSTITSADSANAWTQSASAQDAMFTIDGTAATSPTNTVTSAIQGVTLNLTAAAINTADPAATQMLTVAQDTSKAQTAISSFVSLYNNVVAAIGQVTSFDNTQKNGSQGAALLGDSMVTSIQSTLSSIITSAVGGGSGGISLASIGISLVADGTPADNGTLTLNSSGTNTLANAISGNPAGVAKLFNSINGVAAQMTDAINKFTSTGGLISNEQAALNSDLTSLTTQQSNLTDYTAQLTAQFQAQFTALNTLMATANNNSQYLTQLFGGANSAGALAGGSN